MSHEDEVRQFSDLIDAFADHFDAGETIYHYTSMEGFKGIIASSEIWLTNTAFVNDTTECRAFWGLPIHEVLGTDPFPNQDYAEKCWGSYQRLPLRDDQYIASFSGAKDLLSQFHMYGAVCIGFDAGRLVRPGFSLYRCVYANEEIIAWIRDKFSREEWNGDSLNAQEKRGAASYLFSTASVKYKNRHYQAEKEVRLFSASNPDLKDGNVRVITEGQPPVHFRDHHRCGLPIPYVKFFLADRDADETISNLPFEETPAATRKRRLAKEREQPRDLLPITEVRIGPMMHQREARIACEILLQTAGYEHVKIEVPNIPHRGS